jgi:tripartite-type tricarboxylate transporter receptor subunit TctC
MQLSKRTFAFAVTAVLVLPPGVATAQPAVYPAKSIHLVLPLAPGGSTDVTARMIADKLPALLGQPVVVENRAGAGGQVGLDYVVRAPNDGYTVLYAPSSVALLPFTNKSFTANIEKDLVPIAQCCIAPLVLTVNASNPAKTVQDLLAQFKTGGARVNFAASGVIDALAATAFGNAGGFKFESVRYAGGAPAVQALVAGDVQFTMLPYGTVKSLADAGRLRILAVTSPARYAGLPNTPTLSETLQPGFDASFWNGFYVPAGTPASVIAKLNGAINAVMIMEDVQKKVTEFHMTPLKASPEQTRTAIVSDLKRYEKLTQEAGVKPE